MKHLLPLALLAACAPPAGPTFGSGGKGLYAGDTADSGHHPEEWLEDHWTETAEVCELPEPFAYPYGYNERWELPESCTAQLYDDLGVDVESFLVAGHEGEKAIWMLTNNLWLTLGLELGSVTALREDADSNLVREPFIEGLELAAETLGQQPVREVLYNVMASTVLVVRFQETLSVGGQAAKAGYDPDTHEVILAAPYTSSIVESHLTLIHEVAH